jgi:NAD+ synthase
MNEFDAQKEIDRITSFLKDVFRSSAFSNAVIGVSGGVDSAVSLSLGVRALGAEHMYPLLLPYGSLNTQGVLDAMELIVKLQIPLSHITRIDVKYAVDTLVGKEVMGFDAVRKGNIMARIRMTYLFDQAKKRNALVVGTENNTEQLLGYYTRFGDEASDVEPIIHLYKTEVYKLATNLPIPQSILIKPPSAGLYPEQTDEKEFGFSYKDADQILSFLHNEKKSVDDVVALGFDKELVNKIQLRVSQNSFKHRVPYRIR